MIEKLELPESSIMLPLERHSGLLLKGVHELHQITCVLRTFRQHVHVIRHHTVSMQQQLLVQRMLLHTIY